MKHLGINTGERPKRKPVPGKYPRLAPLKQSIVRLYSLGRSTQAIAEELGVRVRVVQDTLRRDDAREMLGDLLAGLCAESIRAAVWTPWLLAQMQGIEVGNGANHTPIRHPSTPIPQPDAKTPSYRRGYRAGLARGRQDSPPPEPDDELD